MAGADESQIYRELMRFKPDGLSANAWAVKAGVSRTVWSDMRRHGNPSRRTLEKLLAAAGSSLAEFEALRIGAEPGSLNASVGSVGEGARRGWNPAQPQPLPLLATALAGEWGKAGSEIELLEIENRNPIERLPRPPSLATDGEAYAITVVGDSMWPRFRPGRRIAVSPRSPIAIGDDVLVILRASSSPGSRLVLLKELIRRTNTHLELRQFNPDSTLSVRTGEVETIHKVCGELI